MADSRIGALRAVVDSVVVDGVGIQVFKEGFQDEIAVFVGLFPRSVEGVSEIRILGLFETSPAGNSVEFPIG